MESSQRGALGLVRLIAICLIAVGLLDAAMYFTQYLTPYFQMHNHVQTQRPASLNIFRIILDSLPIITGIIILIKARAIAQWLADLIE